MPLRKKRASISQWSPRMIRWCWAWRTRWKRQASPPSAPAKKRRHIEGSKVFAKNLMKKYGIPTAEYEVFDDPAGSSWTISERREPYPAVIKADGSGAGQRRGHRSGSVTRPNDAVHSIMEDKDLRRQRQPGRGGGIPDRARRCRCWPLPIPTRSSPMVSSMDHKRAYDNDEGPNTGGMGTIAPSPYYTRGRGQALHGRDLPAHHGGDEQRGLPL